MHLWGGVREVLKIHDVLEGNRNPEKVRAILEMVSPKTVKEVQKLIRRIAAFNKFVLKATDKCLPSSRH